MSSEDNYSKVYYSPSDLIAMLAIKESTLRKYAYQLERAGWSFGKNDQGHRQYSDKDIMAIRRLISAKVNTSMTLEQAANELVPILKGEGIAVPVTANQTQSDQHNGDMAALSKRIDEQTELINKQTEFIKLLSERLEERDTYIQKKFEEQDKRLMDRDNRLMEGIRMLQEQREEQNESMKLIAAATNKLEEQKKQGFIARLFGRT